MRIVLRMNEPNYFDLFAQWLAASGYSTHSISQYPSRVRGLSRRLDLRTASVGARRALLDSYAPATLKTLLAAYRLWRKWLGIEFPDQLVYWPPLSGADVEPLPPQDVLEAVVNLREVLGVLLLRSLVWEQVDFHAQRIYGRVAGVVTPSSVLARGKRVAGWCQVLLDWGMEGDVPDITWPVVVLTPGSVRPVSRTTLFRWCASAEKNAAAVSSATHVRGASNRSKMGPLPPRAPAPPAHIAEAARKAAEEAAQGAKEVEVPDAVKTSLRAALGREPSQAELHAAMGVE